MQGIMHSIEKTNNKGKVDFSSDKILAIFRLINSLDSQYEWPWLFPIEKQNKMYAELIQSINMKYLQYGNFDPISIMTFKKIYKLFMNTESNPSLKCTFNEEVNINKLEFDNEMKEHIKEIINKNAAFKSTNKKLRRKKSTPTVGNKANEAKITNISGTQHDDNKTYDGEINKTQGTQFDSKNANDSKLSYDGIQETQCDGKTANDFKVTAEGNDGNEEFNITDTPDSSSSDIQAYFECKKRKYLNIDCENHQPSAINTVQKNGEHADSADKNSHIKIKDFKSSSLFTVFKEAGVTNHHQIASKVIVQGFNTEHLLVLFKEANSLLSFQELIKLFMVDLNADQNIFYLKLYYYLKNIID
jgi:regulator of replication initiation timing